MNVHHLELFYYVAKHRGVSAAARHIPYGIQQPAISAQIIQLEDSLGKTLFHRRPFELTQPGKDLYAFIEPFFNGLSDMSARLRGGEEVRLSIGAPAAIQYNYLPKVLRAMQKRFPMLVFTLITGRQEDFEQRLLDQEIDIAFTAFHGKVPPGIKHQELAELSLALLVKENSWIKTSDQLWKQDRIEEPLLTVPASDSVCLIFQQELQRRKVEWFPSMELNSMDLVSRYVVEGFGVGLALMQSEVPLEKGTRLVPLVDFPVVPYAALWLGKLTPLLDALMKESMRIAEGFKPPR